MKRPSLTNRITEDESTVDDQLPTAILEALSETDKTIEIRPANQSGGMGLKRLLLLGAGAIGLAYWVQNSQKPDELIRSLKDTTATQTDKAAETIEEGSETAADQIEASTERAGDAVQEAGKNVADRTEEAGEKAADEADSDATRSSMT